MSKFESIFHLAIPCNNLDDIWHFYIDRLGCPSARRYSNRITLSFFGAQLVCHLSPEATDDAPQLYPRHFGLILESQQSFDEIAERVRKNDINTLEPGFTRFEGEDIEHQVLLITDPSNNVIEFKCYRQAQVLY